MNLQFEIPDELDLFEFFESDPIERSVEEGYWCYETADSLGVTLRFSFHLYERSVQTVVSLAGHAISRVSHEAADKLLLRDGKLECHFSTPHLKTKLILEIGKKISVEWFTLRI